MPPGEPSHVRPRTRTIQNTPPLQAAIADPAGRTSTTSGADAHHDQTFTDPGAGTWLTIDFLPGVELMPLAQPVPDGSIHRARLGAGTTIPVHTHPADEFVLVLSGTIETGGRRCEAGTFWTTPAGSRQGPHIAVTEVELLTVRLGALGPFGDDV